MGDFVIYVVMQAGRGWYYMSTEEQAARREMRAARELFNGEAEFYLERWQCSEKPDPPHCVSLVSTTKLED